MNYKELSAEQRFQFSNDEKGLEKDRQTFKPLFNSLWILGSLPKYNPFDGKPQLPAWKYITWNNCLVLLLGHAYFLHLCLAGASHATRTSKFMDNLVNVICTFRILAVVISMDHFIFGQKELRTYLEQVFRFSGPLREESHLSLKRFCWFSLFLGWFYLSVSVIICIVMAIWTDTVEYLDYYVYNISVYTGNNTPLSRLLVFNDMLQYELIPCIDIFVIQFYLMVVHLVRLKVQDFGLYLNEQTAQLTKGDRATFNHLMREHTKLVELIYNIDFKYNTIVFLWYMDVVINIMFSLPTLFIGAPFTDVINSIYFIWDMIGSFMKFFLVSIIAAAVNTQEGNLGVRFNPGRKKSSVLLCNTLSAKVSSNTLYFTGLRAFRITKSMILSFMSGIIAYTVIFVQIMPKN